MATEYKIIDISAWNSNVPYATLKSAHGIKGAIIRITEKGNKVDSKFETHWKGCLDGGLSLGVYKYSYATTIEQIKEEANVVLKTLGGRKCPLGVWLDVEDKCQLGLSKELLKKMIEAFATVIEDGGYHFGIYTGKYVFNKIDGHLLKCDFWIAAYPYNDTGEIVERIRPNIGEVGWQYSSKYKLNGGDTDISVFKKEFIDNLVDGIKGATSEGGEAMAAVNSNLTVVEKAIEWMEALANDDSHGYDQIYRWGERGDYDCSSAVITAWETAGIPVKSKGGATYTGNMYRAFMNNGFKDVTSSINLATGDGLIRGDVLLNDVHHTAMYCGNGLEVEASVNEKGKATGGVPGDQTKREVLIRSYRNYPWTHILRFGSVTTASSTTTVSHPTVQKGSAGTAVMELQSKLRVLGYNIAADGDFGSKTLAAVRDFQKKYGLEVDGIVGKNTWAKLEAAVATKKSSPSTTRKYTGVVTVDKLNVRTGAGTNYPLLTAYPMLNKGNQVDVCDEVTASSGGKWYYIRIAAKYYGYVSANYVVKE